MIRRRFALRSFRLELKAVFLGLKHPCFFFTENMVSCFIKTWSMAKRVSVLQETPCFILYIYPVNGGLGVKGFTPPCLMPIQYIQYNYIYTLYIQPEIVLPLPQNFYPICLHLEIRVFSYCAVGGKIIKLNFLKIMFKPTKK